MDPTPTLVSGFDALLAEVVTGGGPHISGGARTRPKNATTIIRFEGIPFGVEYLKKFDAIHFQKYSVKKKRKNIMKCMKGAVEDAGEVIPAVSHVWRTYIDPFRTSLIQQIDNGHVDITEAKKRWNMFIMSVHRYMHRYCAVLQNEEAGFLKKEDTDEYQRLKNALEAWTTTFAIMCFSGGRGVRALTKKRDKFWADSFEKIDGMVTPALAGEEEFNQLRLKDLCKRVHLTHLRATNGQPRRKFTDRARRAQRRADAAERGRARGRGRGRGRNDDAILKDANRRWLMLIKNIVNERQALSHVKQAINHFIITNSASYKVAKTHENILIRSEAEYPISTGEFDTLVVRGELPVDEVDDEAGEGERKNGNSEPDLDPGGDVDYDVDPRDDGIVPAGEGERKNGNSEPSPWGDFDYDVDPRDDGIVPAGDGERKNGNSEPSPWGDFGYDVDPRDDGIVPAGEGERKNGNSEPDLDPGGYFDYDTDELTIPSLNTGNESKPRDPSPLILPEFVDPDLRTDLGDI